MSLSSIVLSVFSLVFLLTGGVSLAQENRLAEVIDSPMGVAAGLTNIEVGFCNSDNTSSSDGHFSTELTEASPYELCIQLHNQNDVDVELKMGFVDGAYTVDTTQKRSCKGNEFVERFGQYVSGFEPQIIVPARSVIQKNVTIDFPEDYVGSVRGCMVFSLNPKYQKESGGLFDIVVRKAHFIDFYIDGPIQNEFSLIEPIGISMLDSLAENKLVYVHRLPYGDLEFVAGVENKGDLDQYLEAKLIIKNFLGQTVEEFSIDKKLMAAQKDNIRFSQVSLPWYKGYFFVDIELYDKSNQANISRASVSTSVFLFPARVIILLIALFILFHLFGWLARINQKESNTAQKKIEKIKSHSKIKVKNAKQPKAPSKSKK